MGDQIKVDKVDGQGIGVVVGNVYQRDPPPPIESLLDPGTLDVPPITPAQHLIARYQVVDFLGRSVLDDLHAWADSEAPVSVRLVHGPGGAGKTRLAVQWVEERSTQTKGFIKGALDTARIAVLADAPEADLVLDYAESRPELLALLRALADRWQQRRPGRLRLLLLARGAGDWWEGLKASDALLGALLAGPAQSIALPLVPNAERAAHFDHAAACFQRARGWSVLPAAPDLNDPRFGRPLYVHLATFLAGEGRQTHADTVLNDFLDHEARFWLKRAGHEGRETTDLARALRHAVERTVAALTLRNGARDADHLDATLAGLELKKKERKQIKELLTDIYATPTQLAGPLEPDILGEALVLRVLGAAKRHPRWLDQAVVGADEAELTHTFTVLGRAEALDVGPVEAAERHLLEADPQRRILPAFEALAALHTHTAHARLGLVLAATLETHGNPEIAARLEPRLVGEFQHTVQLREVAAWVYATLAQVATDPVDRARYLNNLSGRLSDLGRREDALAATVEAMQHYRALAQARPDAFLPNLATSLNNLGKALANLGRREEALAATVEAMEHFRTLAQVRPDEFLPGLALSLNNLGNQLSDLGEREDALAATTAAVEIRRLLADQWSRVPSGDPAKQQHGESGPKGQSQAHPDGLLADLANSLANLGSQLSDLDYREEAFDATAEAVEIQRRLAQARPDAFLPDLAMSLNNLGNMHSHLDRPEEALAATAEAVKIRRLLAQARPDAFLPDLAMSLNNLGAMLSALGWQEEALAATAEAVEIRRRLAQARPEAFLPNLATALGGRGMVLAAAKRWSEAAACFAESVEQLWPLFERQPAAFASLMGALLEAHLDLDGPPPPTLVRRLQQFLSLTT